jgi:hypothetical protein
VNGMSRSRGAVALWYRFVNLVAIMWSFISLHFRNRIAGKPNRDSLDALLCYELFPGCAEWRVGEGNSIDFSTADSSVISEYYVRYLSQQFAIFHSSAGLLLKSSEFLREEDIGFIILRTSALISHPQAGRDLCCLLVPFLDYRSKVVVEFAKKAIAALAQKQSQTMDISARLELVESTVVTARFEHPSLGVVEREFDRQALPLGAETGDRFIIRLELGSAGRVVGYQPLRDGCLEKRVPADWENIPIPPAPKDLDDPEEMARYDAEMDQYMVQTTALRAQDAARWKATGKP